MKTLILKRKTANLPIDPQTLVILAFAGAMLVYVGLLLHTLSN